MNNILFIDTETTGLPPKKYTSYNDPDWEHCHLVQIAWELRDPDTEELINSECFTIKPNNFIIPLESTNIHGISHEYALQNGVELSEVWIKLKELLPIVEIIVAHNIYFDNKIILSELFRNEEYELFKLWREKQRKCTMIMGTPPGQRWLKLAALYEKLFGEKPDGQLHTADADVAICSKIYFKLINNC